MFFYNYSCPSGGQSVIYDVIFHLQAVSVMWNKSSTIKDSDCFYTPLFQILIILTVCELYKLQKTSSSTLITSPNHSQLVPTWKSSPWRCIYTKKKKWHFYTPLRPRFRGFSGLVWKKCIFYAKPYWNSIIFFNFWNFFTTFFFQGVSKVPSFIFFFADLRKIIIPPRYRPLKTGKKSEKNKNSTFARGGGNLD